MSSARNIGRIVGALLLARLIAGYVENFTLMAPVIAAPGFMVNAAAHATSLGLAVMLGFLLCVAAIAIAVVSYPLFRVQAPALALWFLSLTLLGSATSLIEGMTTMSLLSLSRSYGAAGGADPDLYQGLRGVVAAARNWAHYTNLLVSGLTTLVMFAVLLRATLVPRLLAAAGMAAAALQMYAIGRTFFGHDVVFPLLAPLGLAYLAVSLWLIARGFADRAPSAA